MLDKSRNEFEVAQENLNALLNQCENVSTSYNKNVNNECEKLGKELKGLKSDYHKEYSKRIVEGKDKASKKEDTILKSIEDVNNKINVLNDVLSDTLKDKYSGTSREILESDVAYVYSKAKCKHIESIYTRQKQIIEEQAEIKKNYDAELLELHAEREMARMNKGLSSVKTFIVDTSGVADSNSNCTKEDLFNNSINREKSIYFEE